MKPYFRHALKHPTPTANEHKRWRFIEQHLPNLSLFLLVLTLFGAVLYPVMVQVIPSGRAGVLWKRFGGGTVLTQTRLMTEGLHIVLPWDEVYIYDLRLQTVNETYNAISKDGVNLNASITIRLQLHRDGVPHLHQAVGPDYLRLLVMPEIGARAREVIAEYTAEQVYSVSRPLIQAEMLRRTQAKLGSNLPLLGKDSPNSINLYDVLVLGIDLPPAVIAAINRKADQYYISEEYDFRLIREQKEARRKQIEAQGIRDFQDTVSRGISDSYLRWRGIEATLQLAQSPNSKVVIIGSNKDGMPIILGNLDSSASVPAPPPNPQSGALPPSSFDNLPPPEAAAGTAPSPASAAISAAASAVAGKVLQSATSVATQIRDATKPAQVNVPQEQTPGANLSTPSTATPEVPHAFVPPVAPAKREDSLSGAVHPAVPETSPPQRLTPETRASQPPP